MNKTEVETNRKWALSLMVYFLVLSLEACARDGRVSFPFDAQVSDLEGRVLKLETLRGRPFVAVTYVPSMPDCRKRIERFVALSDFFKEGDIRFVAVDIRPSEAEMFPGAFPEYKGSVRFYKDRTGTVARILKVDLVPSTFFVSSGGKIIERIDSLRSWDSEDFRNRVNKFINKVKVPEWERR
ncbi:MAG: TlpA family protein disulfide reductase [Deltaproteobacteria bacterium]|nr:TlpA family protein disulfide reductase [Deltaproteobacteria bacterium]